ncbi:hypothetical protein EZ428_18690 [Pedobacter frigiditerrae]|uniref:Lipoprotein n=1 Tax=Pedobacter frigiditerrae TaxID=2530452 RepID=A0A4V2MI14_9SPHI|nr:hypothetical protein [Pedobacter frigiditerrae]TCC88666.1 hypothetical protein EZ428_18690 [Pedobacter frigiditerrae]
MKRILSIGLPGAWLLMLGACTGNNKMATGSVKPVANSLISPAAVSTQNNTDCNARFGFCIDYPKNLVAQPESDNGDGRIFTDARGNEVMRASGITDINGEGIKGYYREALKLDSLDSPRLAITTSLQKENFCEVTGEKGAQLYFRRTILKGGVFISASCQVDDRDTAAFDRLRTLIIKSLK